MRYRNFLFLFVLLLTVALPTAADPVLHSLDVYVVLHDNGDADIIERREMTIDDVGTEGYIVIGNLPDSEILNFSVSDETGTVYEEESYWDVTASREDKKGKCGIVEKGINDYELCWGLGDSGQRTYVIRYTITNLVCGYLEADGFNFMFVARGISPSPENASVTIVAPYLDEGCRMDSIPFLLGQIDGRLPADSVKAWSFGFKGETQLADRMVSVRTTKAMTEKSGIIVMLRLEKGILHPLVQKQFPFEYVMEEAFKDSSFAEPKWYDSITNFFGTILSWIGDLLFFILATGIYPFFLVLMLIILIPFSIYVGIKRKKMLRTVDWYRDIPLEGDLIHVRALHNHYYVFGKSIKDENVIGAMVLKLIQTGVLSIKKHIVKASKSDKWQTKETKKEQPCFVIGEYDENNPQISYPVFHTLYDMFRKAAGDDLILEPNDIRDWMYRNEDDVKEFLKDINDSSQYERAEDDMDNVRKVFGLKKFLLDFTLANERQSSEVKLWNDYLIFATLFGVADKVMEEMSHLKPDVCQFSEMADIISLGTITPIVGAAAHTLKNINNDSSGGSASFGGGGSASFGGGGGFSGGGVGGGVR